MLVKAPLFILDFFSYPVYDILVMKFHSLKGTQDILPPESRIWQKIEKTAVSLFELYDYQQIQTPIIEEASLFVRSLGEASDVVEKQMYAFKDRGERLVALRPEATAGVVRAYIENNLDKNIGFAKLYYLGPMFRSENPQAGRSRQFHQIGVEAIGSLCSYLDAEIIKLADDLLNKIGLDNFVIKINTLGCLEDRKKYRQYLKEELKTDIKQFCPDCQKRFNNNVLRLLDCKNPVCKRLVAKLKPISEHICPDCQKHFKEVKENIELLGVKFTLEPHLVRGLDYYTRTVFEITHPSLGGQALYRSGTGQDAIGAGGRYDGLVKEMGGADLGACGFALGVERIILALKEKTTKDKTQIKVYLACLGEKAYREGFKILHHLRQNGISADIDYEDKSLKAQMREADKLKAEFVLIIGDDELKKGVIMVRNMQTKEQKEVKSEKVIEELK